jgi:4-hydroxy-2-oxoheptanedioate aldolase
MPSGTTLKRLWSDAVPAYGMWSGLDDPVAVEIAGRAGFDFVVLDLQHGFASMASAPALMNALEHTSSIPVIRVPWNTPDLVMRALDLGAAGVIVPLVNNAGEARRAADACRYAPAGNRSWGPLWTSARAVLTDAGQGDDTATCIVMIETAEGLANVEEIVRVDGVHAVYVGPNDLSLSLGLGRQRYSESPALNAAIEAVITAARAAGVPVGVDCNGGEDARYWRERGADFMITHTDSVLLAESARAAARLSRSSQPPTSREGPDGHTGIF